MELQRAMGLLAAGERAAFDDVFRALWPRCRAFARKLIADDEAAADDAAQQALIQLFAESPRFDPARSVVAWALTLTAWQVRTAKKKRERRREDPHDDVNAAAPSRSPEDAAVRKRLIDAALDVVDGLSAEDRLIIARALDADGAAADATQRKRKQRAFERLRTAWRERYG